MNNTVIGTAVLDRRKADEGERLREALHILCQHADGSRHRAYLPVRPKGTPEENGMSWEYEIKGESLTVRPSLRIHTTRQVAGTDRTEEVEVFHNSGEWSIPFREFVPGEYVHPSDLFREINGLQEKVE